MSKQRGYIYERNEAFHVRYYVREGGIRKQKSSLLCRKDDDHYSKTAPSVSQLCADFMLRINTSNVFNDETPFHSCPVCGQRCKQNLRGKFAPTV